MIPHTQMNLSDGIHPFMPDDESFIRLFDLGQIGVAPEAADTHGAADKCRIVDHGIVLREGLLAGLVQYPREKIWRTDGRRTTVIGGWSPAPDTIEF